MSPMPYAATDLLTPFQYLAGVTWALILMSPLIVLAWKRPEKIEQFNQWQKANPKSVALWTLLAVMVLVIVPAILMVVLGWGETA